MADVKKCVVREVHETMRHIAHVKRVVPAMFEGERYDMPAPDSTRTLCDKPVNNGIIDHEVDNDTDVSHVECPVCRAAHEKAIDHIKAIYYGEDGE